MSRFQSTISTFAAIGTIGLTVVAVYRAVDEQKQRELKNQQEIQSLRQQLEEQRRKENSNEPVVVPSIGLPGTEPPPASPHSSQPPASASSPPLPPPPLPEPEGTAE
jgi:cytoskeletal protein RodZ